MKKWWNPVYRCLRFGILHLLLTELSFDTPGVEIGAFLKKKKNLSPIYIEVFYTYDASAASDQKHGFLKFWTLEFENGVQWSWGTTLDDSPKKITKIYHSFFQGVLHKLFLQEEGIVNPTMLTFCQCSWVRQCKWRRVGDQKKILSTPNDNK